MPEATEQPDEQTARRGDGEGSKFFRPGRGWHAAVTGKDGRRVMRRAPMPAERGAEAPLRE